MRRGRWWSVANWFHSQKRVRWSDSSRSGRIPSGCSHGSVGRAAPTQSVGVGREFNSPPWHQFITREHGLTNFVSSRAESQGISLLGQFLIEFSLHGLAGVGDLLSQVSRLLRR